MVQHGVAEDEVEALVLERQRGGVAGGGLDVEAEPGGVGLQRGEHAGRDVGAGGGADDARLQHVEAEVARAGADLQRARERAGPGAEQLGELADDLLLAVGGERDAPLGVVLVRRHVVVAAVDVEDLGLGRGGGHGRRESRTRRGRPLHTLVGGGAARAGCRDGAMTSRRPLISPSRRGRRRSRPRPPRRRPSPRSPSTGRATRPSSRSPSPARATRPSGPIDLVFSVARRAARSGFAATADAAGGDRRPARRGGGHAARRRRGPPRASFVTATDQTRADAGAQPPRVPVRRRRRSRSPAGPASRRAATSPGRKVEVEAYGWAFAAGQAAVLPVPARAARPSASVQGRQA